MADRKLVVQIIGDSKSLERAFTRSSAASTGFNRDMTKAGGSLDKVAGGFSTLQKSFAGAFAAGVAVEGVRRLSSAASDLNEQLSKSNVVFGSSAAEIEDWSKTLASSFGVAQTQALGAASTFGALFGNTGQTAAQAATLSRAVVELASDLASFNNVSVDDALLALRSGLSGEIEPLRRFQVFMTEASVAQQALADTGKTSKDALTQGEKIMARYKLIVQQTSAAQGDFARTSGGLANQQRILAAQTADLEAKLGTLLLPAVLDVTKALNVGAGAALSFGSALGKIGDVSVPLAGNLGSAASNLLKFSLTPIAPLLVLHDLLRDTADAAGDVAAAAGQFGSRFGLGALTAAGEAAKAGTNNPFKVGKAAGPTTAVSSALANKELDARLSGSRDELKRILLQEADSLRRDILNSLPEDQAVLKQALLGVTQEIKSIDDEIIAGAKAKADAAREARAKLVAANKAALQAFKNQADAIKSAVLSAFDTKQSNVNNRRALEDAKASLRTARLIGAPGGISQALRGLQDANLAIQRQRLANSTFRVTDGPKGPVNALQVGTQNFYITGNNPEAIAKKVIAIMGKTSKTNAGQSRGRNPGRFD